MNLNFGLQVFPEDGKKESRWVKLGSLLVTPNKGWWGRMASVLLPFFIGLHRSRSNGYAKSGIAECSNYRHDSDNDISVINLSV
jgi:hypothetical protein